MTASASLGARTSASRHSGRAIRIRIGLREGLPTIVVAFLILMGWTFGVRLGHLNVLTLPSPDEVWNAFVGHSNAIATNTVDTLEEAAVGFVLGNVLAIACAAAFVYSRFLRSTAFPVLLAVQAIPLIAIAPILNLWLGTGLMSKALLAAFITYTVTLVNMVQGLGSADAGTLELLHTLRVTRMQELFLVRFPTALPFLFTSLKLGAASSIVAAIAAEYIGALSGLGYLLQHSMAQLQMPYLWAVVLVIGVIGMLAYGLVALIERVVLRNRPKTEAPLS